LPRCSRSRPAAALAVVKPVVDCAQLASVDLTDIGGAGSTITSATVTTTTVNGNSVSLCAVKGTLAPANTFAVALPSAPGPSASRNSAAAACAATSPIRPSCRASASATNARWCRKAAS
jgi:hypothetical protein